MALTPMMQQYMEVKENYQDCILFFRLGDFYEMFFDDAIKASKAMEVTLTGKNCGLEERAPMCGVPFHAVDTYVSRLIDKGFKVAICEQMEDPSTVKGIVKREVVKVITPGTVTSQAMLNEKENNYLASAYVGEEGAGLSWCDLSTGEINAMEMIGKSFQEILTNEVVKIAASEILINEENLDDEFKKEITTASDACFTPLNELYFKEENCRERICRQFKVTSLTGLGLAESHLGIKALGGLLAYLFETQKQSLNHLLSLNIRDTENHMSLDKSTIKNLEITETLFEGKTKGSLLGVLDKTHTAMGSRKMKLWLREPLHEVPQVEKRLNAVELLADDVMLRNNLIEGLKRIYDLERLTGRVACGNANGRDLIALRNSVYVLPDIKAELVGCGDILLEELESQMDDLEPIRRLIDSAIEEDPPYTIKEGGLIKEGYSQELDDLKYSIKDGQLWIAGLENVERERTGIKSLKVGFNKVFGYYIEVTKANSQLVPEDYIRKQTLVNCERYITPELKEVESTVLNAETKINQLEYQLFNEIKETIQQYISVIQRTSAAISSLDVLTSFAEVSSRLGYVKPEVNDSDRIVIEKGRHPVIEDMIKDGVFVSNDTFLDRDQQSLLLITGPNMAGKSTYMRQTALIVLMAQAGCFVPAHRAEIGIVDRIYTRIGASDNLAQGQSTFYVEMSELAYILNTATEKSLIILDEIGRGTSTYDGLSIAWAVVERLCMEQYRSRTLFATHYHELTALEGEIKGLCNLNVDVQEQGGSIVFLHKIVKGSTSKSYGIHVAKLAGVPAAVLDMANEKLLELERTSAKIMPADMDGLAPMSSAPSHSGSGSKPAAHKVQEDQLSFFSFAPNPVVERLKSLDLMEVTPSQAIAILEELKGAADKV